MLALDDAWVWDFWTVHDGECWHLFHLQAPKSVPPDERHWCASVGHAVSDDLSTWEHRGTVLEPGAADGWDGTAIWTGSVAFDPHRDRWLMAYTGVSRVGDVSTERIGLAWSDDLERWEKDDANPAVESDPRWYERPGASSWQHGWRDPYVWVDDDGYHLLISARTFLPGDPFRRGAIGQAHSSDGRVWRVGPPVVGTTARVAQLEVPHLITVGDVTHLIVSTNTDGPWPRDREDAPTLIGTASLVGTSALGSFGGALTFVDADPSGSRYAGRVIHAPDLSSSGYVLLAFIDAPGEEFPGVIADPVPVSLVDGRLVAHRPVDVDHDTLQEAQHG